MSLEIIIKGFYFCIRMMKEIKLMVVGHFSVMLLNNNYSGANRIDFQQSMTYIKEYVNSDKHQIQIYTPIKRSKNRNPQI